MNRHTSGVDNLPLLLATLAINIFVEGSRRKPTTSWIVKVKLSLTQIEKALFTSNG